MAARRPISRPSRPAALRLLCVLCVLCGSQPLALARTSARCGTPDLLRRANAAGKSASQTERPSNQQAHLSPSGRFLVHYDTHGSDAVRLDDVDLTGVPDFVEETALAFDDAWTLQIDKLGYAAPPLDADGIYDVYLSDIGAHAFYGLTWAEDIFETQATSYIELDNDYLQSVYFSRGLDGMRVSAAHEFFHAVQFGYSSDAGTSWWQELTAVWMEDVAYDDVNDYTQYLQYYFQAPQRGIDTASFGADLHTLGGSVLAHHLSHVYGAESIRVTWEGIRRDRHRGFDVGTIDSGLPPGGFAGVFPRFAVWNTLTGDRTDGMHYPEAADYPDMKATTIDLASGPGQVSGGLDHLAAAYVVIPGTSRNRDLSITVTYSEPNAWATTIVSRQTDGVVVTHGADGGFRVRTTPDVEETILVLTTTATDGSGYAYQVDINTTQSALPVLLPGDFDGNGVVGFSDFILFAGAYGRKPASGTTASATDMNDNGVVDFTDFLAFSRRFGDAS